MYQKAEHQVASHAIFSLQSDEQQGKERLRCGSKQEEKPLWWQLVLA